MPGTCRQNIDSDSGVHPLLYNIPFRVSFRYAKVKSSELEITLRQVIMYVLSNLQPLGQTSLARTNNQLLQSSPVEARRPEAEVK